MAGSFKNTDKAYIGETADKAKKSKDAPDAKPTLHWWLCDDEHIAGAVYGQALAIIKNDEARIAGIHLASRLYEGNHRSGAQSMGGLSGLAIGTNRPSKPTQNLANSFNIMQSNVDTLVAKMVKNKPLPFFLTSMGDSKLQRKAKGLNNFVKGVFFENDAYKMGQRALRDGLIWPAGLTQVYREHGRIKYSRVLPEEILVDYLESHYGVESTRTMHRLRITDRTALAQLYPDKAEWIMKLAPTADAVTGAYKSVSDTVALFESWHLPSSPGGDDGVHCVTSGDVLLHRKPWKRPTFPFAVFRYSENLTGWWGQSLVEQLMPIQMELNRNLRMIQQSLHMMGTFKILVHAASKIVDTHFDNRIGTQIKWSGTVEPSYITPPAVQPEVYQQIPALKLAAAEQSGLSQLSSGSQKPAGLDSGKALETYHDIESDRFQTVGQAYEDYYLQLANLSVWEAKELAEELKAEGKKLTFKVPGRKFLDTVDWAKVDMEEDQYALQCFPISKLPSDPAGRLETIQELIQGGFISQDVGNRLLDYPDLDAEQTLQTAMLDYLHMTLDAISEGASYRAPDPDDNLQMALKLGIEYLTVGKRDRLSEDRLQALRDYITQVNELLQAAAPPPMAAAPQGNQPTAAPEPTPTSDLVPNGANAA